MSIETVVIAGAATLLCVAAFRRPPALGDVSVRGLATIAALTRMRQYEHDRLVRIARYRAAWARLNGGDSMSFWCDAGHTELPGRAMVRVVLERRTREYINASGSVGMATRGWEVVREGCFCREHAAQRQQIGGDGANRLQDGRQGEVRLQRQAG